MAALARIVGRYLRSTGVTNLSAGHLVVQRRGVASKLFVGGLSFYTTKQGLYEAFSQFGQVIEAKIVMDRVSDRSKGFGFVTFTSEDEAHKAITEMNGKLKPSYGGGMPIVRTPPEPVVSDNN